ncbi:hypothetical protein ACJMK2_034790 [Sinanodonta woodiana]|uniref:Uncharacterized protein n=1 Tax=Sinanodonta woodiana TaxID=1069815 RepID=A0ABD3WSW2_SINWO
MDPHMIYPTQYKSIYTDCGKYRGKVMTVMIEDARPPQPPPRQSDSAQTPGSEYYRIPYLYINNRNNTESRIKTKSKCDVAQDGYDLGLSHNQVKGQNPVDGERRSKRSLHLLYCYGIYGEIVLTGLQLR